MQHDELHYEKCDMRKEPAMQLNAYLLYNGNCEEAFKFYEKCLGGKIEAMLQYGGTPTEHHLPPGWGTKIMHARLVVGDAVLMGSDDPMNPGQTAKGFSVALGTEDP